MKIFILKIVCPTFPPLSFLAKLIGSAEEAQRRFLIILVRALLLFGCPSHRIESQLVSMASVFSLPAQFIQTPSCVQIFFGKPEKHASATVLVKANVGLDLGRMHATHSVYRAVFRNEISATEGCMRIKEILARPPLYSKKLNVFLTFVYTFALCGTSFGGSILDMCVSAFLSIFVFYAQSYASGGPLGSSVAE